MLLKDWISSILKTVSGGYDGKGQWTLKSDSDLENVHSVVENQNCILEGFVPFTKEISVIVTEGQTIRLKRSQLLKTFIKIRFFI